MMQPIKIYTVWRVFYSASYIAGYFRTKDAADRYIEKQKILAPAVQFEAREELLEE